MEFTLACPPIPDREAAGPPRAARIAVSAVFFMNGGLFASWVSRLPAVQTERSLGHGTLGLALLVIALGAIIAMPIAGWLSARYGSNRITCFTGALYCLGLPLLMLVPAGWPFMVALFCFGVAHGGLDVAMNTQAVAVEKQYGRAINSSFHALFSLGGLAGAAAGGLAATREIAPVQHFAWVASVLGAVTFVIAVPRLRRASPEDTGVKSDRGEHSPKPIKPPRSLILLGLIAFCVMMGEGATADWSAIFLRQVSGASEGLAAAGYAAFSVAMAVGRFSGDWLSMRVGPVNLVRFSGAIAAGGLALTLLVKQPAISLVGLAAVGIGFAAVVPQVFTAAARTPGISSAAALSTATTIGYFGFLAGPPLIGFTAEVIGLGNALWIVAALSVVITMLAPAVGSGTQRRSSARSERSNGDGWILRPSHGD
jgi:predicted MFS family arabinose efflux permease